MKVIYISLFLVTTIGISARSQINIGGADYPSNMHGRFSSKDLDNFKKTTTLLVLREKDMPWEKEFQQALQESWTITPFKIIHPEDVKDLGKPGYSYLTLSEKDKTYEGPGVIFTQLNLWIKEGSKKKYLAMVDLYPNIPTMKLVHMGESIDSAIQRIYHKSYFYNYSPGLLVCYLKFINTRLLQPSPMMRSSWKEIKDSNGLHSLAKDTLYIPDYVLTSFNPFSRKEKVIKSEADLFKEYPYPHMMLNDMALSHAILDGHVNYVLVYTKVANNKLITIYNAKTGDIIYNHVSKLSYDIKSKDFDHIARLVQTGTVNQLAEMRVSGKVKSSSGQALALK